jgi:hypothetical protein
MARFNPMMGSRHPFDELASPSAVGKERKDLLDISSREDGCLKMPGMIVRMHVRLGPYEPVQSATVIEMIFDKGGRHSLGTKDFRTQGSKVDGD